MICKEFIELSKLLKEGGIGVNNGIKISNTRGEWQFVSGYRMGINTPEIQNIITIPFILTLRPDLENIKQMTQYRNKILAIWDAEQNKPLHECPKLCAWLVGEV